jgi:hypothetical protein
MRELVEDFAFEHAEYEKFWSLPSSAVCRNNWRQFYESWLSKADQAKGRLTEDDKLDQHLLKNCCRRRLHALNTREQQINSLGYEAGPFLWLLDLEAGRWSMDVPSPTDCADMMDQAKQGIEGIKTEGMVQVHALKLMNLAAEAQGAWETWQERVIAYDPEMVWWCTRPAEQLTEALGSKIKALEEACGQKGEPDDALVGTPVGRESIEESIRLEEVPCAIEQMLEIAEHHAAWCRDQMARIGEELGAETWWDAVQLAMKEQAKPGVQAQAAHDVAVAMTEWLERKRLITIPEIAKTTWRIDMNTLAGQKTMPYSPYGGQCMIASYPPMGMDHETKGMSMRGNSLPCLHLVTPHELIPGHHLQLTMSRRYRPDRRLFSTPFFVEGWTLHWEMLQFEEGWGVEPLDKIGMLWWRLHRCMRIIVSLGFHVFDMPPEEMVHRLVDDGAQPEAMAIGEVRRYIGDDYPPLYQCAYLIGGLMMHKLYDEMRADGWSPMEFHDRVLKENGMPIWSLRSLFKRDEPAGSPEDWSVYPLGSMG